MNTAPVCDTFLEPARVGLFEVLEEVVGIGDVVDGAGGEGGGRHVVVTVQPVLHVEEW